MIHLASYFKLLRQLGEFRKHLFEFRALNRGFEEMVNPQRLCILNPWAQT
jgi:hypothetical protein